MRSRADRPIVIVDISVPRDVDAGVAGIAGVALFDIDDLERVVEANLNGRRVEAERGEGHVRGAVKGFATWRRGLQAAPAITSLRARAEEIRRVELDRVQDEWEGLSEADRQRLEVLTTGIVNKLLHEPTVRVRAAAETSDALRHVESFRHLFGLEVPVPRGPALDEAATVEVALPAHPDLHRGPASATEVPKMPPVLPPYLKAARHVAPLDQLTIGA